MYNIRTIIIEEFGKTVKNLWNYILGTEEVSATTTPPDVDDHLEIEKLMLSMQQYPWFYYEIFLNPSFVHDAKTAHKVGAKADADPSVIKEFLNEYPQFANLSEAFSTKKSIPSKNKSLKTIVVASDEFIKLKNILSQHLVLQLSNKELKSRFDSSSNKEIKFVNADFYNEMHGFKQNAPEFFKQTFGNFLQQDASFFAAAKNFIATKKCVMLLQEHILRQTKSL